MHSMHECMRVGTQGGRQGQIEGKGEECGDGVKHARQEVVERKEGGGNQSVRGDEAGMSLPN